MIDYDRTLSVLGVDANKLTNGSIKRVFAICENCGKYREVKYQDYKELCKSCCRKGELHHNYGKHLPEETKQKLSKARTGKRHSEESRKKSSEAHKGKYHSDETRKKQSLVKRGKLNTNYGKKTTEETKKKMSIANQGSKNGNWKGGLSFGKYCHLFNNTFKESVRNRYNRMCFLCGKTEEENNKKLCVHHINYDKNCLCGSKCEFVPLCNSCHTNTNYNRQYWEDLIMCYLYPEQAWLQDI